MKGPELSPDDSVLTKGNLAHEYQFEKKAIYLENKDAKLDEERSFSHAVLDDFKELEEAGITHPDMEKLKLCSSPKQRRDEHFQRRND